MAYTKEIKANDTDANQSSPGWMLTFLRWSNRDTFNYKEPSLELREPLIVINDCIRLQTSSLKQQLTPSMSATLIGTDINYSTAIAPGDFVLVNIVSYDEQTRVLYDKAKALEQINKENDGFKGIFKVQSVRRNLSTSPDGIKRLVYQVQASAFTELNNIIYFNPYLLSDGDKNSQALFIANLGDEWKKIVGTEKISDCQSIMLLLFKALIGEGFQNSTNSIKGETLKTENRHFALPTDIGKLLGNRSMKYAADMFQVIAGIQQYLFTNNNLPLKQYQNQKINSMYPCHRVSDKGEVLPTIVIRQIPFTTEHFTTNQPVTKYMSLPRWKIDYNLVLDYNIGREEAARFNYVQLFGHSDAVTSPSGINQQIAQTNYVVDKEDIIRNGLRPIITTSNFDYLEKNDAKGWLAPEWAKIRADWLINGHLKENGTLVSIGIQEPICEGDNFELGDYVFHIEGITHACEINNNGVKTFRTIINLSHGTDKTSTKSKPVYDEMTNTDAWTQRKQDNTLPGIGDIQTIPGRLNGEEIQETKQKPFTPK